MSNLMDYVHWRGDLSFAQSPFNEVDAALLAVVSYVNAGREAASAQGISMKRLADILAQAAPINKFDEERHALLPLLAASPRFAGIRITRHICHTDVEARIQFSATTCLVPEVGAVIAFRGTDATLVGWREDFMMCYESPVPAQAAAKTYLSAIAGDLDLPLWLTGHSKGGNLAAYAAIHAVSEVQDRLRGIYSFDGPGLDDESMGSPAFQVLADRIHALVPQSSIIGLLMSSHPRKEIVDAEQVSILQHDPFTWQVMGPAFARVESTTLSSQIVDETLHAWLREATPEQRRFFVNTVFDVLAATNAETTTEIKKDSLKSAAAIVQAITALEPEARQMALSLLSRFVTLGVGSAVNVGIRREAAALLDKLGSLIGGGGNG